MLHRAQMTVVGGKADVNAGQNGTKLRGRRMHKHNVFVCRRYGLTPISTRAARIRTIGSRSVRATGGGGSTRPVSPATAVRAERMEYSTVKTQSRGCSQNCPITAKVLRAVGAYIGAVTRLTGHELAGDVRHSAWQNPRVFEPCGLRLIEFQMPANSMMISLPVASHIGFLMKSPGLSPRKP